MKDIVKQILENNSIRDIFLESSDDPVDKILYAVSKEFSNYNSTIPTTLQSEIQDMLDNGSITIDDVLDAKKEVMNIMKYVMRTLDTVR